MERVCSGRGILGEPELIDLGEKFSTCIPRALGAGQRDFDFKRSSPVLFFCAVIPRGLASGIGAGRAKQIYWVNYKKEGDANA